MRNAYWYRACIVKNKSLSHSSVLLGVFKTTIYKVLHKQMQLTRLQACPKHETNALILRKGSTVQNSFQIKVIKIFYVQFYSYRGSFVSNK